MGIISHLLGLSTDGAPPLISFVFPLFCLSFARGYCALWKMQYIHVMQEAY